MVAAQKRPGFARLVMRRLARFSERRREHRQDCSNCLDRALAPRTCEPPPKMARYRWVAKPCHSEWSRTESSSHKAHEFRHGPEKFSLHSGQFRQRPRVPASMSSTCAFIFQSVSAAAWRPTGPAAADASAPILNLLESRASMPFWFITSMTRSTACPPICKPQLPPVMKRRRCAPTLGRPAGGDALAMTASEADCDLYH